MIYIIVICYLLFLIYTYDMHHRRQKNVHFWILFIFFTLLAGLSYRLGVDCIRYENHFYNFNFSVDILDLFNRKQGVSGEEPLWVLVNRTCYLLFKDFQVMKFFIAVFVNGTVFWFLRKHSPALYTSILLYFLLTFANLNFEALRESLAICFFLIAFDKLDGSKRGYIKYFLYVIPCFLCHRFGFICFIFPLFLRVNYSRNFIFFLIASFFAIPLLSSFLSSFIEFNLMNAIFNDRLDRLAESNTYGFHEMNIWGYMELLVLTLLPLLVVLRYYKDGKYLSFALVYVIVVLMTTGAFTILFRVNDYLVFPTIIALSGAIKNAIYHNNYSFQKLDILKNGLVAKVCLVIFLGFNLYSFIKSKEFVMYYPYASVITKSEDPTREAFYSTLIYNY